MRQLLSGFFVFCLWLWTAACIAQNSLPITIDDSADGQTLVTLGGLMTQDWIFKPDHPLNIFDPSKRKKFEAKKIEILADDCQNCDENWAGSHVEALGILDEDPDDPQKALIYMYKFLGKPQPLNGPLYQPYQTVQLEGRLFLMKCAKGEGPVLKLNAPINVAKGGEFAGPAYGVTEVQPVGVDVSNGLKEGPAEITGKFEFGLNEGSPYESHLCLETSPTVVLYADSVAGAKDRNGKAIGVKVIYFNSDWQVFRAKNRETLS